MYTAVRRIHLYCGVILLAFVVMYFVTGFVMIHPAWFPAGKPTVEKRTQPFPIPRPEFSASDPAEAAEWVKGTLGLRGMNKQAKPPAKPGGPWEFVFAHPGETTRVSVTVDPAPESTSLPMLNVAMKAVVTRSVSSSVAATMAGFHEFRGFGHGAAYNAWSVMVSVGSCRSSAISTVPVKRHASRSRSRRRS